MDSGQDCDTGGAAFANERDKLRKSRRSTDHTCNPKLLAKSPCQIFGKSPRQISSG
jgi:hypothetical protein